MQFNKVIIDVLSLAFIVRLCGCISGWKEEEYPNVFEEPHRCGRPNGISTTRICDPDSVLSVYEAKMIDATLKQIQNTSNCVCTKACYGGGFQLTVALLGWMTIELTYMPKKEQAYKFASYLYDDWFERADGCDNNVIVFYAHNNNQLAFSLGEDVWSMVSEIEFARLADSGSSRLNNRNETFLAIEYIIERLSDSIQNGPSLSLNIVYLMTVVGALTTLISFLCLVSNTCCRVEIQNKSVKARQLKQNERRFSSR